MNSEKATLIVTTQQQRLAELKSEGYKLIGVDGTVPHAQHWYDYLFDHHRHNGADIQLDEMESLGFNPDAMSSNLCLVTPQVDADAIAAAFRIQFADQFTFKADQPPAYNNDPDKYRFLRAISYDCDHLGVPDELSDQANSAAMVVAALKEESKQVIPELGLPEDSAQWSLQQKESFESACFKRGVDCLYRLLEPDLEWNYRAIAEPYWETLQVNTQKIIEEQRIREYRNCLIFNQVGMTGYIDPRCWLRAYQQQGFEPELPVTVTKRAIWREGQFQGYAYTLGTIPLHPRQNDFDYTTGVFNALTKAEQERDPNANPWGGRATVGGSGRNTPTQLTPEEVIDIVLTVIRA